MKIEISHEGFRKFWWSVEIHIGDDKYCSVIGMAKTRVEARQKATAAGEQWTKTFAEAREFDLRCLAGEMGNVARIRRRSREARGADHAEWIEYTAERVAAQNERIRFILSNFSNPHEAIAEARQKLLVPA